MISVRLDTGQTVTFDDGTDEDTMREAISHVLQGTYVNHLATEPSSLASAPALGGPDFSGVSSGTSSTARHPGPTFDLSHVTANGPVPLPAANSAGIRLKLAAPAPDFSNVVGGSSTATDTDTDPTAAKRAELAQIAATGDINAPEARDPFAVDREFFRGLPARAEGAMLGSAAMPVRVGESIVKGIGAEIQQLGSGTPSSTGEGFRKGFTRQWSESGVGQGADLVHRQLVDPAQQRLLDVSIKAGMSPEVAALTDTGQAAAAEALNPVNYIAPHELIAGLRGADAIAPAAVRAAELEAQGGARGLEQAGIVTQEFGRGSAPSEILQAQAARSGDFLPGAKEPLIYSDSGSGQLKGTIPDGIRAAVGRPWREYGSDHTPLVEPDSPPPMPRSVDRDPLPLPPIDRYHGITNADVANVAGIWDYASRRYPTLASKVSRIRVSPTSDGAYFEPATGIISMTSDSDLGTMMHEFAHIAQSERGQDLLSTSASATSYEPYAVRAGDVYSRIPQPLPRSPVTGEITLPPPDDRALLQRIAQKIPQSVHGGYGDAPMLIPRPEGGAPPNPLNLKSDVPLPLPVVATGSGGKLNEGFGDVWSYLSRRYPRLAGSIKTIVPTDGPGFASVDNRGVLYLGSHFDNLDPEKQVGVLAHELAHQAQSARGQLPLLDPEQSITATQRDALARAESYAVRTNRAFFGAQDEIRDILGDSSVPAPVNYQHMDTPSLEARLQDLDRQIAAGGPSGGPPPWQAVRERTIIEDTLRDSRDRLAEAQDSTLNRLAGVPWRRGELPPSRQYGLETTVRGLNVAESRAARGLTGEPFDATPSYGNVNIRPAYPTEPFQNVGRVYADGGEGVTGQTNSSDLSDLANSSLNIGSSPMAGTRVPVQVVDGGSEGAIRRLSAVDGTGNQVGSMTYTAEPGGGFRVIDVETGARGTGAGREMYAAAAAKEGPYRGSMAQTPEGEGFVNRLRETNPEIFADPLPGQHANSSIHGPMSLANDPVRDVFGGSPAGAEWQQLTNRMKQLPRGAILDATASQEKNAIMNRLSEIEAPLSDDQVNHLYGQFNNTFPMHDPSPGIQDTRLSDQRVIRMTKDGRVVQEPATMSTAANANVPVPTGPRRLYAGGPPPPAPLSEADTAAAMGWAHPLNQPGSPNAIIDPIHLTRPDGSDFQTNFAAQLGPKDGPVAAQWIVQYSDEVLRKIGAPQSWDTAEQMASMSGTTKEEFLQDNPRWNTLAPEERLRMSTIARGTISRAGEIQEKIAAGTATEEDKAELLRQIDNYGAFIKMGAKSASDYGRALNMAKMEARMSLGDDFLLKQQVYRKYAAQLDKEKPLMDTLARLNPKDPDELQALLRQVNKPKLREFMQEIFVNSILSSPVPFERKVIGDTIMMLGENGLVRPIAAVFDAARGGVAGSAKSVASAGTTAARESFLVETPAAFVGLGRGIQKGFQRGIEVLQRGYDPRLAEGNALFVPRSAFARAESPFVRNVVGPFVTMPTRVISAATTMARTMNFTAELYAQAARVAAKEELLALKGGTEVPDTAGRIAGLIANPTDEMLTAADKFAGRTTFTDETSAVGKAIVSLRDLPNVTGSNVVTNGGLEVYRAISGFLLPFIHIADRLMVRGLEYTPLSAALSAGERSAGNYAEAASSAARATIGSAVMAYAASLAYQGRLTGAAPTNPAERAAFYAAGKQPFSIISDSGTVVPYGHMQPIAMPLALVASMHDGWQQNPNDDLAGKITDGAMEVGTHISDQSYLLTLSKLMEVLHGSEQGRAGRAGSDLLAGTLSGMAPYSALTRTIAKTIDPRVIDDRSFSGKILQNMPVASLGLTGKLDPWGEEVVPQGGRARTFLASGTALLSSQLTPQPLDDELARLGMPLGYVGSTISDHKKQVKLSDDEHFQYQQLAGRASKLTIGAVIAREGYAGLDTEVQRSQITQAIGAARKYARIVTLRAHNNASNYPGLTDLGSINMVNESARE